MIITVTGGTRSGKTGFAENFFDKDKQICYIATSKPLDDEMRHRILQHRQSRPKHWRTCERFSNLSKCIGDEEYYILDDITNIIAEQMYEAVPDMEGFTPENISIIENKSKEIIFELVDVIRTSGLNLIMVTNEVGMSIVPVNKASRVFRDIQGRVNQYAASASDRLYLICCGVEMRIK